MKFSHLADSHIGGWKEEKLRELSLDALKKAIDISIEARIFVVIFAVLSLISGLITIINVASSQLLGKIIYGFITLGFNALVLIFILLSQESKHYFS